MASILIGLLSELLFVWVILLFYKLLKDVVGGLALATIALILLQVPLSLLDSATEVAVLQFIRGGDFLILFKAAA